MGEEVVTGMEAFITGIGQVITGVVGWLATTSTALISNEIFMLIIGIVVFLALAAFVVNLVSRIKARNTKKGA